VVAGAFDEGDEGTDGREGRTGVSAATWDRRSPEEHERVRGTVLSRWLPAVGRFSPFWRAHLEHAGVDPDDVTTSEDLGRIPAVAEGDVLGAGGAGSPALVLRPREDDLTAIASPGTLWRLATSALRAGPTGKRRAILVDYKPVHLHRSGDLSIAYSRSDLDRLHRCGARAAAVLGLGPSDYLVSAVPCADRLDFWGVHHLALGASLLALHPRSPADDLGGVIDAFARVPATAVAVPVAEAVHLAGEVGAADLTRVRTLVLVGPPPSDGTRGRIADAWRASGTSDDLRVLALWAPPEARALWAECAEGGAASGLHTYPDLDVVEVGDGERLTYTSLGWNGTALLRYLTGARIDRLEEDPCPGCGRTVPRIVGVALPTG
jgi:phenylacetate-coenzyme A ligase PaaK-like adenylate-forming protein